MKLKLMPVLTGAIALASLAATPLIVKALPTAPGQPLLAQGLGQGQLGQRGGMRGGGGGMNLTEDQRAQIKKIREQTQKDIRAVLTKEQRAQYDAAMQESRQSRQSAMQNRSGGANGGGLRGGMNGNGGGLASRGQRAGGGQMGGQQAILNSLNLSEDQQQEIQEIMKRQREQMQALLTDSQRQQLQQRSSQFGTQNQ